MSAKKIINSVNSNDVSSRSGKPASVLNRPYLLGFLAFIIFGLLFSTLIYQRLQIYRQTQKKAVFDIANSAKDKLQQSLAYSLSAAKTLSFFINDAGIIKDFDSIAPEILESSKGIDALQLVPDGIIRNVYPLKGNESVIGYDILKDSTRNKEAFKAIEKNEMFFAGPFQLKQGGVAVVGRLPVFRNNKFWGFSAVIIKMPTLLRSAGLDGSLYKGYHFQLSKINPDTGQQEFFISNNETLSKSQSVSVDVPDGEWKLSVARVGENKNFDDIILLAILASLLSVLGGIFVYRFAIRPTRLSDLVEKQTMALKASEKKYRSLIERVSDAFISLDKDWNYTYVNQKAGELFARTPESLIGQNIWEEFPEGIDKPFYHAYYRAMVLQSYQYINEYYEPYDKWFVNHIYPSKDGLTIFFKDVTEIKKISLALKENEERYRSLIEQASDGIVITDLDGIILEANNSIVQMTGFSFEELLGKHLSNFLPDEDKVLNPLRINELMEGKSLLYERRLLKKDRTILDVEINSKMASTHTLIGFIRNISERKKAKEKLVEKEKKFQQVLASIADNFYVIDTDYNIVIINKVAEKNLKIAWGKPVSIGTNLLDVIPGKGEEPIRENFERAFAGEGIEYEMHLSHPDLPTCVLIQFSPVIDESGRINGVSVIAKDISERKRTEELIKESEERYRALVENAPEALVVFDEKKLMFVNVSESATRLFGMSKEDLLKIGPVDVSPKYQPDGRLSAEAAQVHIQKAINGEKPSFEWTHCKKSGELISCEVWLVRLPAENEVLIRGSIVDITERNEAKALLQKSYEDIRQLVSNLQNIREDERTKMAREIHDELGQQLTGLKMDLHWLSKKAQNREEDIDAKIQGSIELINATIATVRKIATDLRPSILDDLGLLAALEWQGDEFEKRSGTKVLFINNTGELKMLPAVSTELFRIYQELLTNIARHAKASQVTSSLVVDDKKLYFSIADNGIGFNKDSIGSKRTLGLLGIKERTSLIGGTYEINSKPGKGTETIISIPLNLVKQTF